MRCIAAPIAMLGFLLGTVGYAAEPWTTYRGNPERTANNDGIAGPKEPKVLWAVRSQVNYIASPVPVGERLIVSGLGGLRLPTVQSLPIDPSAKDKLSWQRSGPYLKNLTVSSPAVFNDTIIFGDGMHDAQGGATLYCLPASGGLGYWQLPVPGELVHLEGSPTILDKRVYIGGGSAGVIAVATDKAAIDGKDYDLPSIAKMKATRFKELQAKYEIEKKTDEFALPPREEDLPKATPKLLWQQGKDKWHVDAPVNVIGDKVLVASAYLDKEKVGDRSLYCLNATTGAPIWNKKLTINPWGGPSVGDGVVVVTGSTISYDTKLLKGAKGEVVAFDLATGAEKWSKAIPTGGVLGCASIAAGQAIFTCSDGKVRSFALKDGERRMLYDAKTPIFAPPAVVGGVVYVADLKGVVHAIDLKTGAALWTLDLGTDPQVKAPGMVFGGIAVQDGKLFLATCNHEGAFAGQPTVVVCIGAK